MKSITILGATGSIGTSTATVVRQHRDKFSIKTLIANSSVKKLADMAKEFNVQNVGIYDEQKASELRDLLQGTNIKVAIGRSEVFDVISQGQDFTMSAIVGIAGLEPTVQALKSSKYLGLANKESMVCAGDVINQIADENNCKIIPVDSEHSAIFQVLDIQNFEQLDKITLTASGGMFRDMSLDQMQYVTSEQATKHPNWDMGAKITVDCATLMNKGLEVIETSKLFGVGNDKIDVLVHRESIIHSMVTYNDGSTLAQLGIPDMCTPIAYSLSYPHRIAVEQPKLDLAKLGSLTFSQPDHDKFPLLKIARQALDLGQRALIVLNVSNEIAVANFSREK